ncbi:MAG TPA: hypothetical protein VH114_01795 [Candidatus Acidoferrum sp.]|jgi:hypothetical protein|nr:hypothetical protein [Candidatus Acidoferrum sp.]
MARKKKSIKHGKRKKPSRSGGASRKKPPLKRAAPKRKPSTGKTAVRKRSLRGKSEVVDTLVFQPRGLGARSGGQSGDLQGLSGAEGAESESVEELLEEGNAFEADIVKGVEDAQDADESEVKTHEVPEDDVPEEYSDEK